MTTQFAKKIRQLERRFIPNVRNKEWYKIVKFLILLPSILLSLAFNFLYGITIAKLRFKRSGKPDIILDNIVAGWSNLLFSNPTIEKLAMKRAKICAECPSAVFSGTYSITTPDNNTKQIRGLKCAECGCALSAKVRSANDRCPLGKW